MEQYKCTTCGMIPSDQEKAHKYSHPRLQVFDKCNRCGGKHALVFVASKRSA